MYGVWDIVKVKCMAYSRITRFQLHMYRRVIRVIVALKHFISLMLQKGKQVPVAELEASVFALLLPRFLY